MRRRSFWQSRRAIGALVVLLVLAGVAWVWGFGSDDSSPQAGATPTTASPTETESATETEPTRTPSPTPSTTPTCEGDDTLFNVEGVEQDSLLPDCGEVPVTTQQQANSGLGLACGGSYPVILYKTTTADTKSSICGVDSSGAKLRVVIAPDGEPTRDLKGIYEYQLDAFVAEDGNTTYIIRAYDGTLVIQRGDGVRTEKSLGWISLDNESDGEAESENG